MMQEPSHTGRSDGWKDRLKRSGGAKFRLMVTEEDIFCVLSCAFGSL